MKQAHRVGDELGLSSEAACFTVNTRSDLTDDYPGDGISEATAGLANGIQLWVGFDEKNPKSELLRIDAVVLVPSKSRLKLITQAGGIDARKLDNPQLEVSSQSGDLNLSSTASIQAKTELGNIRALMM